MPNLARLQLVVASRASTLHEQLIGELCSRDVSAAQLLVVPTPQLVPRLARDIAWSQATAPAPAIRGLSCLQLAQALTATQRREEGRQLLSPEAALWMTRRFLERGKLPPGYFDQVLQVRGFRNALLRAFQELAYSGLVTTRSIERLLVQHAPSFRPRVRHCLELFHAWRQAFEATHDDPPRVLADACGRIAGSSSHILRTPLLRVYGFTELRPLEWRLLEAIATDPDIHMQVWVTQATLLRSTFVQRLQQAGFQERQLAGEATSAARVEVLSAPGEESEAIEVGRRILRHVDAGYAFHRIGVQTRNGRSHATLREIWGRLGIPCESIPRQSLLQVRAGRALMQFLAVAETGLMPRTVMDFLTLVPLRWSDWCGLKLEPIPSAWGRVAIAARLGTGIEDWQTRLPRFRDELLENARRFSASGEPSARAKSMAQASDELLQVAEKLGRCLRKLPERGRWRDYVRVICDQLLDFFERDRETLEIERLVRRLAALEMPGHTRASRAEFREAVRYALGAAHLPPEFGAGGGAVVIGTEDSLRGMNFDRVILMGLRDGEWPSPLSEDPILSDKDRALISQALGDPDALAQRAAHAVRERVRFDAALYRGNEHVLLSYARLDPTTGASRLPSTFLMEWAETQAEHDVDFAAFENLPDVERVPLTRRELPDPGPVVSLEEYDAQAIAHLGTRESRRYVRQLGNLPSAGLMLEAMRNRRRRFTAFDGMLQQPDVQESLRSAVTSRPWSISQINAWSTCPFRFFMRRMLQLEPLDTDTGRELDALAVGRLVHDVLERFYRRLQDLDVDPHDVEFAALRQHLHRASQQSFAELEKRGQTGSRLLWQLRKQTLLEDLTQYLRHELRRGEWSRWWLPSEFEMPFGPGEALQLQVVAADGASLDFRGVVDRLDRHTKHRGLSVVDYKSGRKLNFKRYPAAGQLVVYLLAATAGDAALLDSSEARFVYVTRRGGFAVQRMRGEEVGRRRHEFEALVRSVVEGAAQGDFHPEPGDKGQNCTFCDYRALCDGRIAPQSARKLVAGQGERFANLPDFSDLLHDLPAVGANAGPRRESP